MQLTKIAELKLEPEFKPGHDYKDFNDLELSIINALEILDYCIHYDDSLKKWSVFKEEDSIKGDDNEKDS